MDIVRFMVSALSNLVHNPAIELHRDICKDCKSCFEYVSFDDGLPVFKYIDRNKNYEKEFNEELLKRFGNKYRS